VFSVPQLTLLAGDPDMARPARARSGDAVTWMAAAEAPLETVDAVPTHLALWNQNIPP